MAPTPAGSQRLPEPEAQSTSGWTIEAASEEDLPAILALIGADPISSSRRGHQVEVTAAVRAAWRALDANPDHALWVARSAGAVIGTLQCSRLPGLARNGMWLAIIESVHVRADWQGRGVGSALVGHAAAEARQQGCGVMQLTSDRRRARAHAFYERLGFVASHVGMKLDLAQSAPGDSSQTA